MANLRSAKKDVLFFVNEVISDCYTFLCLHPGKKDQEAAAIIEDAMALGENMFEQIANYPRDNAKAHFKQVNQKLLASTDELFQRISGLTK